LTGDLVEKFREGRSHGWFWKQVLIAIAVGVLGEVQRHWPHFSYAIAGTAVPASLWKSVEGAPRFWHWWVLPWPWSQLVLECSPKTLLALAALPVLAAALVISWAFRWVSLLWTTLLHYLLGVLDTFPWLRPSCVGQSASFCDSKNAARHGAIDLFRLSLLGVAGLPITPTRQ